MATRTETFLTDDLDGNSEQVETVRLAFQGTHYEIDLGKLNRGKLSDALSPYIGAAREIRSTAPRRSRAAVAGPSPISGDVDRAAVRAWARERGETIGERGRIPTRILDDYRASHPNR